MIRLLFVGHTFHTKSGSSAFFLDLLRTRFSVETAFVEPENLDSRSLPDGDFDLVVLWQVDFLAPYCIAAGFRTVVVPMYDASAGLPDLHWVMMREALFINFSTALHVRAVRHGCRSIFARYFPDPATYRAVTDYSRPRAFFWRRRPAEISLEMIDTMLGDSLKGLHVHNAPDYGTADPVRENSIGFGRCEVTQSTWFETADDYLKTLESCNIYVAPRLSEGIGMGFLEAMARGMVVFANDRPTHNEYIGNWYNGVLFNHAQIGPVRLRDLPELGASARRTVELGHRHWRLQAEAIADALEDFAAPPVGPTRALIDFAHSAMAAYATSTSDYDRFLSASRDEIEFYVLGRLRDVRRLLTPQDKPEAPQEEGAPSLRGAIAGAVHLAFGQGNASPFLEKGWSTPEGGHTWIDGDYGALRLPNNPNLAGNRVTLWIDAFTVDPIRKQQTVDILIDEKPVATVPVSHTYDDGGVIAVRPETELPETDSFLLEFRSKHTWTEPDDKRRRLSLALRSISIVRD